MVNLDKMFAFYNKVLFDNELYPIPVRFVVNLDCASTCACEFVYRKKHPQLKLLRDYHLPHTMAIYISSKYKDDDRKVRGILIHEMTRAWFFSYDIPYMGYGKRFRKKIRKLSAKAGVKVPYRYASELA